MSVYLYKTEHSTRKTLYFSNLTGLPPTGGSVKKLVEVVLLLLMIIQCKKALVAHSSAGVSNAPAAAWVVRDAGEHKRTGLWV